MRHERRITLVEAPRAPEDPAFVLQYCTGCGATWEPVPAWRTEHLERLWGEHLEEE